MQREAVAHLWEPQRAGRLVQQFVDGRAVDTYVEDTFARSAVERQLTIVGEALNGLSQADPVAASGITDMRKLATLRTTLVQDYATVDSYLVWRIIEDPLPSLLTEVDQLLAEEME